MTELKLNLNAVELETTENKRYIKKAITTAHKVDKLTFDIHFLKSDIDDAIKENDFSKVAELSNQITKISKQIIKLEESLNDNFVTKEVYKEVKHESFFGELDWTYIANRNIVIIEAILFEDFKLTKGL